MVAFFCYVLRYLMDVVFVGFPVCLDIRGPSVGSFKSVSRYVSQEFGASYRDSLYQLLVMD